jgi:glutamate synthase (NADPH) large chain
MWPQAPVAPASDVALLDLQQAFGTTQEDIKFLLAPMASAGEEAIGSMGNDSPLAVLSDKNKPLYNYFKQLFAQVTNPPIDPIREAIVMSLVSFIGPKPNLLDINQVNPPMRLEVSQPILDFADMAKLRNIDQATQGKFKSATLDITYPALWGREGVEAKLASLCAEAVDAIKGGHNILIISDRGVNATQVAVPALAGAVGHSPASGHCGPAHHRRLGGRNRHRPRSAPLCCAGRLRRRSRAPLPGHGNPGRVAQRAAR